ncbi:protein NrdI [Actinomycetota bacterium]|uniref:Protein NrdI n=2 Tax=Lawsonella clevelandensis TaxID=1528099 RepID=A0A2W5IC00_9ACTN|nr:class Ib ribonucleoside-diphosphate reductase assembly flavoprotein NrdI [Lawsonella clevelandensis]PZP88557.1 MAG: class Ib ribonucleoside-diphosphate reductase assembly flavoprotein NrdI [Lawsonella clevelandensis]GHT85158.1 protein NrdI [Actinomycetota bacterium]
MLIVYFSSTTENTHHFVHKLGLPSARIPIKKTDGPLTVTKPYVLICPTYGGGVSIHGGQPRPVPIQVIRFLNDPANRALIRGVISGGNTNFGADYGTAGDLISHKCHVPHLYRFELMGNDEDVTTVRNGLIEFFDSLPNI